MDDPIERVIVAIPVMFFRSLQEQLDAAFAEACRLAGLHAEEPERPNTLGQLRHTRCEAGFRHAATEAVLFVEAPHTSPLGGRYSLVHSEGVYLIRSNVQTHCGQPRATRFRKKLAALNRWLNPVQPDLFHNAPKPSADHLCGMIVATAYARGEDPSVPAFAGLGFPRDDLSDWAVPLISLGDLLARYHDAETRSLTPKEPPVEVKDEVVIRLKRPKDV